MGGTLRLRREPQLILSGVAASRLFVFWFIVFLGLTPQAKSLSPLRGSSNSSSRSVIVYQESSIDRP